MKATHLEPQAVGYGNVHTQPHATGYGSYVMVWLALLVFTALTVAVAGLNAGGWNIATALGVAICKTTLVLLFFMHLKYEDRVFLIMLMVSIITLATVIGLTFFDVWYRIAA